MNSLNVAVGAICIAAAPASAVTNFQDQLGEAAEKKSKAVAGMESPPRLVRGITDRHYPREVQRRWPSGGAIFVRLLINPNGRAVECHIVRSFGDPESDRWTCKLIIERGRFRPAVNQLGEPVTAWYGYVQRDRYRFDPSLLRPPSNG